ncbi:MAG: uL14 family ribosomal protein, partial [Candidatus Omnitrophica bacterium]|nr:uL14 family ribosomal protein [Candidatus Omnitrophota bacterium]
MIYLKTRLDVADNTGAKKASCIGVIGCKGKLCATIGDIITVNIKDSSPEAIVKKGEVAKAVIVRMKSPLRRPNGTYVKFESNAIVF